MTETPPAHTASAAPEPARLSRWHASAPGRVFLSAGELLYRLGTGLRGACLEAGLLSVDRPPCPVISIGNLTAGGTGKTPLVEWFLAELLRRGRHVAVLSRGYGRQPGGDEDDEAFILRPEYALAVRLVDPCRRASARRALAEHGSDCLLLDDGFQHRRVARDLDVVVIDATNPFGFGRLLPLGLLREPPQALRRANLVVLNRVDHVPEPGLTAIEDRIQALAAPDCARARAVQRPVALRDLGASPGVTQPLEALRGRRIAALAAIGNPDPFFKSLETLGASVVDRVVRPDHRPWTLEDLAFAQPARAGGLEWIVATEKDAVSLARVAARFPVPIKILRIAAEFVSGADRVQAALDRVLSAAVPGSPESTAPPPQPLPK